MFDNNERELLLLCARQELPDSLGGRAKELLGGRLDWNALAQMAWRHGTAPLLFKHAQSLGSESVRRSDLHALRRMYVRSAFRNRIHFAALQEIQCCFASRDIEMIALKGAALSSTVYRDAALRPFADIDLLIPENSLDASKAALREIGYELAPELLSEKLNRKYHFNVPFARRAPAPIHVELHWRLTDPFTTFRFDHGGLFARSEVDDRVGTRILSREDNLVYLAAHLDAHGYLNRVALFEKVKLDIFCLHELSGDRLIWFTDLHEIILQNVDWSLALERARAADAVEAFTVTLQMACRLLGTPVPDDLPSPSVSDRGQLAETKARKVCYAPNE